MSLKPSPIPPVPEQTILVAKAAFPKGNPYLILRDELGTIFCDEDFADLFPKKGQPAYPPWQLALVTLLQFRENLSDRGAADAVRARIDWKYLLGLTDAGFDFSVLSEFRARLLAGEAEERLLQKVIERVREVGLLKARGRQRTDSTQVLAAVRELNRLELLGETLRATLNTLAALAPEWLRQIAPAEWYDRYGRRIEDSRLPQGKAKRAAYAQVVGEDGLALLQALEAVQTPDELRKLTAVETLKQVWQWHFERYQPPDGSPGDASPIQLIAPAQLGKAADHINSPYDLDVRYGNKGNVAWVGYRVHLSETCDEKLPRLITHVLTTPASTHDSLCTSPIHEALVRQQLAPDEHLVDSAYLTAGAMVTSRTEHEITLIGPAMRNTSWQKRKQGALSAELFEVDWACKQVRCPQGKTSQTWGEYENERMGRFVRVRFAAADCHGCAVREHCTQAKRWSRQLTFKPRPEYEALQAARAYMEGEAGKQLYALRAGVEGTISQGVRAFGLRRTRYRALEKTHLQHVATAAAMNLDRVIAWQEGRPLAKTRTSHFAALAA